MTVPADCPFCRSNNLLRGAVIAQTDHAYLLQHQQRSGSYLVIPSTHVEAITEMSDTWWADFKTLLAQVPGLSPDYNMSVNIGTEAGQTIKHLHFWIIPRQPGEPSSGKGLAKLISEANQE